MSYFIFVTPCRDNCLPSPANGAVRWSHNVQMLQGSRTDDDGRYPVICPGWVVHYLTNIKTLMPLSRLDHYPTLNVIYFNPNASYLGWSKGAAVKLGLLQYLPHPYQLVWNFKRVKPAITVFFSNLFLPPTFHYQSHIWIVISCYCNIRKCSVQLRFKRTCALSKCGNNIVTTASFQWEENIVKVFHYLGRYLCKSILVQFVSYMCYVFTTQLTTFFL